MEHYCENRTDPAVQKATFNHFCSFAAQSRREKTRLETVKVSSYLDVQVSPEQTDLFNPAYKDVLMGFIKYDCKGKGATQKTAKRRLDVISGGVASYARCLNDPAQLKMIAEVTAIAASFAEVSADMIANKKQKQEEAAAKAAATKAKAKKKKADEAAKKVELLPSLTAAMEPFLSGEKTPAAFSELNNGPLKNLIKYYCDATTVSQQA